MKRLLICLLALPLLAMTKRDHEPLVLSEVRGLYARYDTSHYPEGFLAEAHNVVYNPPQSDPGSIPPVPTSDFNISIIRTRELQFKALETGETSIQDLQIYEKTDGYIFIFMVYSGGNTVFKAYNGTATSTILTITGDDDTVDAFHGITINDRFYFAPQYQGLGVEDEFVYVYNPDEGATARKAAGVIATGTFTVSAGTTAGAVVEPGTHIIAISNVTASGYRTKPALFQTYTAPSTKAKIDLDAIPLGPAGTVSRVISMSKVVKNYDGNPEPIELFFALEIANNTTTTLADAINLYDSQLVSSMDIYAGNLQEIPAGNWLTNLDGRLVVSGAFDDPHTLRVSHQNEPEAIDEVDGLREIMRGDGQSVNTTRPYHGDLFWWKSTKTGIMKVDPTLPPSEWPIELLDGALGAETFMVGEVLNSGAPVHDTFLVGNADGLHVFSGVYHNILKPLTFNIEGLWRNLISIGSVSVGNFGKSRIVVDPFRNRVYVRTNLASTTGMYLMGDFNGGLNADSIKWATWDAMGLSPHVVYSPNMTNLPGSMIEFGPVMYSTDTFDIQYLPSDTTPSTGPINPTDFVETNVKLRLVNDEYNDLHIDSVRMRLTSFAIDGAPTQTRTVTVTGDTTIPQDIEGADNVTVIFDKGYNVTGRQIDVDIEAVGIALTIQRVIIHGNVPYTERPDR